MITDNKATYNIDIHKYVLNRSYLEQKINASLTVVLNTDTNTVTDNEADVFLERVSNLLYTFIYAYAENPDDYEYYLSLSNTNKQLKNREAIISALVELAYEIIMNNKEIGIYFNDKDLDIIPNQLKQQLYGSDLITRSKLVGLPYDYMSLRGSEY